jgi:hypothetical protein
VVNALNRRVHEMHATAVSMYKLDLCDISLEFSKSDMCYVDIKVTLQQVLSHKL